MTTSVVAVVADNVLLTPAVADDTVIAIMGDHGWQLGQSLSLNQRSLHRLSLDVLFVLAW